MKVNGVTSYPIAVTMLAQATSSTYPLCILKYSNINVNNMNNAMMKKLIANTCERSISSSSLHLFVWLDEKYANSIQRI